MSDVHLGMCAPPNLLYLGNRNWLQQRGLRGGVGSSLVSSRFFAQAHGAVSSLFSLVVEGASCVLFTGKSLQMCLKCVSPEQIPI